MFVGQVHLAWTGGGSRRVRVRGLPGAIAPRVAVHDNRVLTVRKAN